MTEKKIWTYVGAYGTAHFLVDFSCAFLMIGLVRDMPYWHISMLLYNFCAFAMQLPLGVLADKLNRNARFAAAGCLLVGAAFAVREPIFCAVTAGIGNGMFHVGGGVDVLNISEKRSGPLGVFVSPGAFGIFLGTALGNAGAAATAPILIALVAFSGLLTAMPSTSIGREWPRNKPFSLDGERSPLVLLRVLCLFAVVCLRSYVGIAMEFPWKVGNWGIMLTCAVVFGKTLGGFLSDALGIQKAALLSLGASAVLFLFSGHPVAGVCAVLLFNMSMPMTLWAVAKIFPGAKGFSFGLLTFGLFLGFLPMYLNMGASALTGWGLAVSTAVSLLLLMAGLRQKSRQL